MILIGLLACDQAPGAVSRIAATTATAHRTRPTACMRSSPRVCARRRGERAYVNAAGHGTASAPLTICRKTPGRDQKIFGAAASADRRPTAVGIATGGPARHLRAAVDIDRVGVLPALHAVRLIGGTGNHRAVAAGVRV